MCIKDVEDLLPGYRLFRSRGKPAYEAFGLALKAWVLGELLSPSKKGWMGKEGEQNRYKVRWVDNPEHFGLRECSAPSGWRVEEFSVGQDRDECCIACVWRLSKRRGFVIGFEVHESYANKISRTAQATCISTTIEAHNKRCTAGPCDKKMDQDNHCDCIDDAFHEAERMARKFAEHAWNTDEAERELWHAICKVRDNRDLVKKRIEELREARLAGNDYNLEKAEDSLERARDKYRSSVEARESAKSNAADYGVSYNDCTY